MFGEKQRKIDAQVQEIESLRRQLDTAEVDPFRSIAVQIQADVVSMTSEQNLSITAAMSMAIDRVKDSAIGEALEARLANIPVLELLRAFDERVGNDEVNNYLAQRALAEMQRIKDTQVYHDMRHEAARTRQVDLSKLKKGSIVTIGLFHSIRQQGTMSFANRGWAGRTLVGRVDDATNPHILTILEDDTEPSYYAQEDTVANRYSDLTRIQIGEERYKSDGKPGIRTDNHYIHPCLTYGTHPVVLHSTQKLGRTKKFYNNDVGYVMVDDIVILDNPDDMKAQIAAEQ